MKKFLINMLIDTVFDFLILALQKMAMRSGNSVDDKMVQVFADNRDEVIAEIKRQL